MIHKHKTSIKASATDCLPLGVDYLKGTAVRHVKIPQSIVGKLRVLDDNPGDCIHRRPGSRLVPMALLVASHIQTKGIANANEFMARAAQHLVKKREPILIRRKGRRFIIVDGNATFINASYSGWKYLRCMDDRLVPKRSEAKPKVPTLNLPKAPQ